MNEHEDNVGTGQNEWTKKQINKQANGSEEQV